MRRSLRSGLNYDNNDDDHSGVGEVLGHLLAPTDIFLRFFGRTDLRISASRAKNCQEFAVEVRFSVDPPKMGQKGVKQFPRPKNLAEKNFFRPKIDLTGIV